MLISLHFGVRDMNASIVSYENCAHAPVADGRIMYMSEIPITLIPRVCPNGRFIQNRTIKSIAKPNEATGRERLVV